MEARLGCPLGDTSHLPCILGWMTGVAWSDNSLCFGCHQDESLKKQDARGKSISLFVSEAGFKNSVHGKLSCSDCHTHIKDDTHAEGGKKAADKRVNCASLPREGRERISAGPSFQDDHEGDGEGSQLL